MTYCREWKRVDEGKIENNGLTGELVRETKEKKSVDKAAASGEASTRQLTSSGQSDCLTQQGYTGLLFITFGILNI